MAKAGRPDREIATYKTHCFTMMITPDEYRCLTARATLEKIGLAAYVRRLIDNDLNLIDGAIPDSARMSDSTRKALEDLPEEAKEEIIRLLDLKATEKKPEQEKTAAYGQIKEEEAKKRKKGKTVTIRTETAT